jgi:predicted N-formylglutamate amidohydrolase
MAPDSASPHTRPSLLAPDEGAPFEVLNGDAGGRLLLVCDHAANRVPRALGDLGLAHTDLLRHIGWDIGAAAVTRELVALTGAPAVMTRFSRLVVDCNRALFHESLMPTISDRTEIPGNKGLGGHLREARIAQLFAPYHAEIDRQVDRLQAASGVTPVIVSIHSFTPVMDGFERPWELGVLWNEDPRLPLPLLDILRRDAALTVGDNEPYTARDGFGYTLDMHGDARGLANALIEIRQDLIDTDQGAAKWAARLATALAEALDDPALYRTPRD